jgi:hypothetical protein
MAMSAWVVLAGLCLFYFAVGLWAVSKIFPSDRATTPVSKPSRQPKAPRT